MLALIALITFSIASSLANMPDLTIPDAQLTPIAWSDVAGWEADDHAAGFDAFLVSCRAIVARKKPRRGEPRPLEQPLRRICVEALALGPATPKEARDFFEARFRPVRIARESETEGFLTGYYEPVVDGSRVPTGEFKFPMYRRPHDLVHSSRRHGAGFPNRGGALRRVSPRKYVPYYDRAEIEDGALDGKGLEICWLRDPIDAFFIHIQGSARIRLEDGAMLRLNYAAHNGHPYTPVGARLVDRGIYAKEEMSMDRIRQWMLANPDEGKELRRQNKSFIFFRIADLAAHEEAVGAQGIPLTPGRSIAVDRRLHTYGTPFWIDAELPLAAEGSKDRFRRLMVAQDTGSAIVGPARADIYFGAGVEQGRVSGRIRHPGQFVMLVPASMFPAQAIAGVPMPRPRPKP